MNTHRRFFKVDGEWNVIHLPDQPNGFAILIIGDTNHFVDEEASLWTQSIERSQVVDYLCKQGYTVFYSNLFNRNWGSPKAVGFIKTLYHVVMKQETLNSSIHILCEGMGGITALKFMKENSDKLRSVVMVNPCLNLSFHAKHEKEQKLFYKRLLKEVSDAYEIDETEVEELVFNSYNVNDYMTDLPIKISHVANLYTYPADHHSRPFERECKKYNKPVSLSMHLREKRFQYAESLTSFFEKYEEPI